MFHSTPRRTLRAAAGFAAMTLPLGLALPAVAADAPDSSPVVTLPEGEAPTPAEQSFVPEASNNQGVVEQSPSE